jgi:hypothetical protein
LPEKSMAETKLGQIVYSASSGYAVVEVMEPVADGFAVTGFAVVGSRASASIIYASAHEAVEALHDLEARLSGS